MAASQQPRVLFISPGNAVRSIFAEYFMNSKRIGRGRFKAFSAGSQPIGIVHPYVIRVLEDYYKFDAGEERSKSWDEFRHMDFDMIITLCDRGKESIPFFPGQSNIAIWNISHPEQDIRSNVASSSKNWRNKSKCVYSSFLHSRWRNLVTYARPLSSPGNRTL